MTEWKLYYAKVLRDLQNRNGNWRAEGMIGTSVTQHRRGCVACNILVKWIAVRFSDGWGCVMSDMSYAGSTFGWERVPLASVV